MFTKKIFLLSMAIACSGIAQASPFVVSDPYPMASSPQPTHCGVWLNAAAKIEIPVTAGPAGVYCKYDVGGVPSGANTVKMSHIYHDAVDPWGDLESPQSAPFTFNRPITPSAPTGLSVSK
jgi:hypothetical protein